MSIHHFLGRSLTILFAIAMIFFASAAAWAEGSSEDVTELRMLYPGTSEIEREWAADLQDLVSERYPEYDLQIEFLVWDEMEPTLTTMMEAGDYPDLMMTQSLSNLVAMDALMPLDEYFDSDERSFERDNFIPSTLEFSTVDGNLYSMPVLAISYGLIVNEDMLNDAGYEVSDLETWDDIYEAADAMTEGENYGYSFAGGVDRFVFRDVMISGHSNDGLDPSQVDREQEYTELLEFYQELGPYMPDAQVTWDYADMFRSYSNETIGMIANGSYFSANVYDLNPEIIEKSRFVPFPTGPSASEPQVPTSNAGFAVIRESENPEAALDVLELIYEEMSAQQAGAVNLTARTDLTAEDIAPHAEEVYPEVIDSHLDLLDEFISSADEYGVAMPDILGRSRMEPEIQEAILNVAHEDGDVQSTYDSLSEEIMSIREDLE